MSTLHANTSRTARCVVATVTAALLLSVVETSPVLAASPQPNGTTVAARGSSDTTDFSAARRHRRVYVRRGNAAGLAFMGAVLGTMGAIIAEQQRRDYYERHYPYYYGSPYYGAPYPYYGPPRYYPY